MRAKIDILRPVNPVGRSFVIYILGALRHQGIEVDKEMNKAIQYLGYKIMETVGKGKWITGEVEVDTDKREFVVKRLEVWEKTEKHVGEIKVQW